MVIDSSAPLNILQDEPERRFFNDEAIEAAERRAMSAAIFVETSIVYRRRPAGDHDEAAGAGVIWMRRISPNSQSPNTRRTDGLDSGSTLAVSRRRVELSASQVVQALFSARQIRADFPGWDHGAQPGPILAIPNRPGQRVPTPVATPPFSSSPPQDRGRDEQDSTDPPIEHGRHSTPSAPTAIPPMGAGLTRGGDP